jgi:hypothetical protein
MRIKRVLTAAGLLAAAMAVAGPASAAVLTYDFEQAPLGPGAYHYAAGFTQYSSDSQAAVSPGVTFNGMSGVQINGSGWGFPNTLNGNQTAFIQSYGGGGVSQNPGALSFDLTSLAAGTYNLSFLDAARPNYGAESFTVSYNGNPLGAFNPTLGWTSHSLSFNVVNGGGPLLFSGFNQTANTFDSGVGIDLVTLSAPAPKPGFGLIGLAVVALAGMALRMRAGAVLR